MAVIEGLAPRPAVRRHDAPRAGRRVIRVASTNEAAVLSCLHRSLTRDTFPFEDCLGSDPDAVASIVLVCEVSEAIAGYICLGDPALMSNTPTAPARGAENEQWELRALGVAPQFRRTDVATDLWRVALDRLPTSVHDISGVLHADRVSATRWLHTRGFDLAPATAVSDFAPDGELPGARESEFHASLQVLRDHVGPASLGSADHEPTHVEPLILC